MLGETYELIFEHQQKKVQFISEKITVVPSITAFHCMSDFFELWGTDIKETNYWGKSIEIQPQGNTYFKIFGENTYVFSNAYTIKISNLEGENPEMCLEGSISFRNLETKDSGEVTFIKGSMSFSEHNFTGFIKNSKGEKKFSLFGIWGSKFILENVNSKKVFDLWEGEDMQGLEILQQSQYPEFTINLNALNEKLLEKLPLTDSRFRGDIRALELGEIKFAHEEKMRIEKKNQEKESTRKNSKAKLFSKFPRFFEKKEGNSFMREFNFKGEYWKIRDVDKGFEKDDEYNDLF